MAAAETGSGKTGNCIVNTCRIMSHVIARIIYSGVCIAYYPISLRKIEISL